MSVSNFVFQSLSHPWLRVKDTTEAAVIKTENLRRYLARRRWVRAGNAVRAIVRIKSLVTVEEEELPHFQELEDIIRRIHLTRIPRA